MPSTLTVSGMAGGLPSGYKVIGPVTDTTTGVVGQITDAALQAGDNTFTIPPSGSRVLVVLPYNTSATVTVRTDGDVSDAGLPVSPYAGLPWVSFPLPSGTSEVILNSSDVVSPVELSFI